MTHERYCYNCAKAVPCQALPPIRRAARTSTEGALTHLMCALCGRHLDHIEQAPQPA